MTYRQTTFRIVRLNVGLFGLGLLLWLFTRRPDWVEAIYVPFIGGPMTLWLSRTTGLLPFGLAEWIEGLAGLVLLVWLGWSTYRVVRGQQATWRLRMERIGAEFVTAALSILLVFYAVWGAGYARPALSGRLGLPEVAPAEQEDPVALLEQVGATLLDRTNGAYLEATGTRDLQQPSQVGTRDLDALIERALVRVGKKYGLAPHFRSPRGPYKPLFFHPIVSRLGIAGFYFPFTGEANVNLAIPEWEHAHTIAHEKAHQRLINSENEANFIAFLACIESEDPYVRYAGWLFAQRQVLQQLGRHDRARLQIMLWRRYPGVQRDVDALYAYLTQFDGQTSKMGRAINDQYLRLNNVQGGIRSYGRAVRLVLGWAEREQLPHGPTALEKLPPPALRRL